MILFSSLTNGLIVSKLRKQNTELQVLITQSNFDENIPG